MMIHYITSVIISIFLTLVIIQIKLRVLKTVDKPNSRSIHKKEKLTSGGISFALGIIVILILLGNYKILSILPLTIIGYLDDIFNLSRRSRYITQVITSIFIFFVLKDNLIEQNNILLYFSLIGIWVFISTAIINLINFMDGIDGLVCSNLIIVLFLSYIFQPHNYIAAVIPLTIFLFWNWHPSKIFMGDTGSTFLGGLLILLLFDNFDIEKFLFICSISSPLLIDSIITILMRLCNKENIFLPHRKHLYQRLNLAGLKPSLITFIYLLCAIIPYPLYIIFNINGLLIGILIEVIIGLILNKKIANQF